MRIRRIRRTRVVSHCRRAVVIGLVFSTCAVLAFACKPKDPAADTQDAAPIVVPTAREVVPPAAPFNATPVAQFADAGDLDKQSPYEQGKVFEANGQLWMARLVLERQALGSDATKDETELLLKICMQQGDATCVESCAQKLGRKIKFDGGTASGKASPAASPSASAGAEHKEPDTELARTRDLVLRMQFEQARKNLEPKVLDGRASREEIRLLRTICEKQGDRMCIALCDAKLK